MKKLTTCGAFALSLGMVCVSLGAAQADEA